MATYRYRGGRRAFGPRLQARPLFRAPDGRRGTDRENRAAVQHTLGASAGGDQIASATAPPGLVGAAYPERVLPNMDIEGQALNRPGLSRP
ncbi:hypothetical protein AB0G32_26100 [Streptomyces sp. NPDC023723]|uniref:hypothetical protein n=1 Tax=Streptomyces sp. NPDC023723 TaxID=3154323 RepID=UPI00340CB7CB